MSFIRWILILTLAAGLAAGCYNAGENPRNEEPLESEKQEGTEPPDPEKMDQENDKQKSEGRETSMAPGSDELDRYLERVRSEEKKIRESLEMWIRPNKDAEPVPATAG